MNRVSFDEVSNIIHQAMTIPLNEEQRDRALKFVENVKALVTSSKALVDEGEGLVAWLQGSSLCELDDSDLELDYLPAVRNDLREF